jgi:hypothetical protein
LIAFQVRVEIVGSDAPGLSDFPAWQFAPVKDATQGLVADPQRSLDLSERQQGRRHSRLEGRRGSGHGLITS